MREGRGRFGGPDPPRLPTDRRWVLLPLNRVPVWTLWRRIRDLDRFRDGVRRYFEAVRYEAFPYRVVETPEAVAIRGEVEGLLARCRQIVAMGGVPSMTRLVAGEGTGEVATVNLISATFELDRHNLRREELFDIMDAAVGHHRNAVRGAWLRTLNPFYWVDMALSVAEVLPFLALRPFGIDAARAANTSTGATARGLVRVLALGGLIWMGLVASGLDGAALQVAERGFLEIWYVWERLTDF